MSNRKVETLTRQLEQSHVFANKELITIPFTTLLKSSDEVHAYMLQGAYLGSEYKALMASKLNANTAQTVSEFFNTNEKKCLFNLHFLTVVEGYELMEPLTYSSNAVSTAHSSSENNYNNAHTYKDCSFDNSKLYCIAVKNGRRREYECVSDSKLQSVLSTKPFVRMLRFQAVFQKQAINNYLPSWLGSGYGAHSHPRATKYFCFNIVVKPVEGEDSVLLRPR